MKIKTAVTINGHLVELVGKMSKSIDVYRLDDDYGSDLLLVDSTGNVMGNIRVITEDNIDIKIKELEL